MIINQFILDLVFLVSACRGGETDVTPQVKSDTVKGKFFAKIFERCGGTYSGEATYPDDPDHELVGVNLVDTIQTCTEEEIRIVLNVSEDLSRTWIISRSENGPNLSHDHRDPDGIPHELTIYGGNAPEEGTAIHQYFAEDDATKEMLPEAETNVWMMEVENGEFNYYLERNSEPRFRAELTQN